MDQWLSGLGIRYVFGTWTGDTKSAYFTGEYSEPESMTEDGLQDCTFILNGFTTRSWQELETAKESIRNSLPQTLVTASGTGLAVSYAGAITIRQDDISLKRIQINLSVKKWS